MEASIIITKAEDNHPRLFKAVKEGSVRSYKNAVGWKPTRFPAGEPASLLVR